MAESGDRAEIAPRGNDWEVVSLTASTYAAAPGPKAAEEDVGDKGSAYGDDKVEASQAMFMSGHFVFPEKQREELILGTEFDNSEVQKNHEVEELASLEISDYSGGSVGKDDRCCDLQGSVIIENILETGDFDGKDGALVTGSAEIQRSRTQPEPNLVEPEQGNHESAEETNIGWASSSDVKTMISELTLSSEKAAADGPAEVTSSKHVKDKKKAWSSIPYVPWWKRQAVSLHDHVKEANPLWFIVIAAAVMGLAVLGQCWQQRKSPVTKPNLQFSAKEEKAGKMLSPISQLKVAFVSGNQGSGSVRSNISSEI